MERLTFYWKLALECIANPNKIVLLLSSKNIIKLDDKTFLLKKYKDIFKKDLNIEDPKSFNDPLRSLSKLGAGLKFKSCCLLSVLVAEERQDVGEGNVKQSSLPSGSLEGA